MRIIAGKYRKMNLNTLEGDNTRPSKDMLKEALFSSLGFFDGSEAFLDLFGGSGAVGLEALSRGANRVVINDHNRDALRVIKSNVAKIQETVEVYNYDYKECILKLANIQFDYIFLDPPYALNKYEEIMNLLIENCLIKDSTVVIWEVKKGTKMQERFGDLVLYKEKNYGISSLFYYHIDK